MNFYKYLSLHLDGGLSWLATKAYKSQEKLFELYIKENVPDHGSGIKCESK